MATKLPETSESIVALNILRTRRAHPTATLTARLLERTAGRLLTCGPSSSRNRLAVDTLPKSSYDPRRSDLPSPAPIAGLRSLRGPLLRRSGLYRDTEMRPLQHSLAGGQTRSRKGEGLVARGAEAHPIERGPFLLHTGMRMGIPLCLAYRQVLGGIEIRIICPSSSWSMGDCHVPLARNRVGTFGPALENSPRALVRNTLKTYPRGE